MLVWNRKKKTDFKTEKPQLCFTQKEKVTYMP